MVVPGAPGVANVRALLGEEQYQETKKALQKALCAYFSSVSGCDAKQGNSISPIGATPKGGKILKVRWGLPGRGKSGSLRLCLVVYCAEMRASVAAAFLRKTRPSEGDFQQAAQAADL
jgi:hypothetical protein